MKLALCHAFALIGTLAVTAIAQDVPPAPATTDANTATDASEAVATNTNTSTTRAGVQALGRWLCDRPSGGLYAWWYNSRAEGPYGCTTNHDTREWAMLNAYRSGGTHGVHWKYTDNVNDPECLTNWRYYNNNGDTVLVDSVPRTTTMNDPRRWCPLPVYRSGGVQGKQWQHCNCYWYEPPCTVNCNP